jgi:hypothetical protein
VSSDSRGTHAMQGFLEVMNKPQFNEIIAEIIHKDTLKFAYNKHATHVLIKFIKLADMMPGLIKIYDILAANFAELS